MSAAPEKILGPVLRLGLGLGIGVLALWLVLREVDLAALGGVWQRVDKPLAAAALLAAVLSNLGKAMRWRVLLQAGGSVPGAWKILQLFFAGQLANLAAPGRLGDLGRAYGMGGRSARTTFALGTVLIEKALDMFMFALLTAGLLVYAPLPDWMGRSAYSLVFTALPIFLGFWWLVARWEHVGAMIEKAARRLPEKIRWRIQKHVAAAIVGLDAFHRPGELRRLVFLTIWIWFQALLVNFLGLRAFQLLLPLPAALLLLVVLQLGFSAALTPAAVGVFEFLCVLSLAVFGVDSTDAFGFGVLLHAIVLTPLLVAGGASLVYLGLAKKRVADEPGGLV